jgi:hypothetical protein
MSMPWYLFISAVVITGLPMALSWAAYQFIKAKYVTHLPVNLEDVDVIGNVVIFSIVGLISAFDSRKIYENPIEDGSPSGPKTT